MFRGLFKRRRLKWLIPAAVILAAVGWMLLRRGGIGPSSYYRIRKGMTQGEVEKIIGMPPGNYSNREPLFVIVPYEKFDRGGPRGMKPPFMFIDKVLGWGDGSASSRSLYGPEIWAGDKYILGVWFDPPGTGTVVGCSLWAASPDQRPRWLWWLSVRMETGLSRPLFE
jgi:hypothetical protein